MLLSLLALLACTDSTDQDSAPADTEVEDAPTASACDTLEIRVTGEDPPHVGDEWTVWLWCDGALLTGATRMIWDPTDTATVSGNTTQFLQSGEASLLLQVGSRRQSRAVSVLE